MIEQFTTDPKMVGLIGLAAIVIVQVIIFQFLMIRISRTMPEQLLGGATLRAKAEAVEGYLRGLGGLRRALGMLLIAAVFVAMLVPEILEPGVRKLVIAALSLLSPAILLVGMIRHARRVLALRQPDDAKAPRVASLEHRALGDFIDRRWLLPVALAILASLTLAVWTSLRRPEASVPMTLLFPALQIVVYLIAAWLSRRLAESAWPMGGQELARDPDPEATLKSARAFRRHDLRGFQAARALIALLLLVIQIQWIGELDGRALPAWLGVADRIVLLILLGLTGLSLISLPRRRRN